jgi:hypothetical protein
MWKARLERKGGRNTEQESIVKDAVPLYQENESSFKRESDFMTGTAGLPVLRVPGTQF